MWYYRGRGPSMDVIGKEIRERADKNSLVEQEGSGRPGMGSEHRPWIGMARA